MGPTFVLCQMNNTVSCHGTDLCTLPNEQYRFMSWGRLMYFAKPTIPFHVMRQSYVLCQMNNTVLCHAADLCTLTYVNQQYRFMSWGFVMYFAKQINNTVSCHGADLCTLPNKLCPNEMNNTVSCHGADLCTLPNEQYRFMSCGRVVYFVK